MSDFYSDEMRRLDLSRMAEFFDKLSEQERKELQTKLENHLANLQDINSRFPETKKFLEARGLSNVRELDAAGLQELHKHLECVLLGIKVSKS